MCVGGAYNLLGGSQKACNEGRQKVALRVIMRMLCCFGIRARSRLCYPSGLELVGIIIDIKL